MSLLRDTKGLAGQVGRLKVGGVERKGWLDKREGPNGPNTEEISLGADDNGESFDWGNNLGNCGVKTGFLTMPSTRKA